MGEVDWSPTQARIFTKLLDKCVPDLSASFVESESRNEDFECLTREELEALAVDLRSGELYKGGVRIVLQGQSFRLLEGLLERPGQVLGRDELRARLWPSDTYVDFEHSINAAVRRLRRALGDSADAPRYIETLPRRGYRFVGTVLDITEQKKFSEELEARITQRTQELKIANDELMEINSKLEKSNKELESFTYVASHDLQEPLRKILFFSDLIRQNSDNQLNGLEKYFNKIMVSTRRMSDLITSLLQYSTISHSSESFTDVNLDTVLQNVKEDYEILIVEKQAIIMSEPLPMVKGNKVQLFQLMANLLSNALKFSRHAPVILIQYRLKKIQDLGNMHISPYTAFHEITIRDNGIGFEQEYSDQIFVIFQRLHHQNDFPGMGLGLALCKKIVDSHHGHIKVSSTPGEGSEFTIYLPAF